MDIGTTIKGLRKSGGMSQAKFADAVGINQATLCLIETNKTMPHLNTLKLISDYTKIPVPLLYIWSVEPSDAPESNFDRYKELWPKIEELANYVFKADSPAPPQI